MQRGKLLAAPLRPPFSCQSAWGPFVVGRAFYHRGSKRAATLPPQNGNVQLGVPPSKDASAAATAAPVVNPAVSVTSHSTSFLALSEASIRARIAQHSFLKRDWKAILTQIEQYYASNKPEMSKPLLWEALVIALLCGGHGDSAFEAWQHGSAMSRAVRTDLSVPTVVALSLYSLLVDQRPDAAKDVLLLLPSAPQGDPVASGSDFPGSGEGARNAADGSMMASYVRLLCELKSYLKSHNAATHERRVLELGKVVVPWWLDRYTHHLRRLQVQEATLSSDPSAALLFLVASLQRTVTMKNEVRSSQGFEALKLESAVATSTAKTWRVFGKLVASSTDVVNQFYQANGARPLEEGGGATERWVSVAREAMSVVDSSEAQESYLSYLPNTLLGASTALFRGTSGAATESADASLEAFRAVLQSLCSVSSFDTENLSNPASLTLASCLVLSRSLNSGGKGGTHLHSLISYRRADDQITAGVTGCNGPTTNCARCTPLCTQRILIFTQSPLPLPLADQQQEDAVTSAAKQLVWDGVLAPALDAFTGNGTFHALEALAQLSAVLPLDTSWRTSLAASTVPFCRHPRVVEAVVEAVVTAQVHSRGSNSKKGHHLALSCHEWREFMHRFLGPLSPPALRIQQLPDAAPGESLSLSPETMIALHRLWWLPECLSLSQRFCQAYEQHLLEAAPVTTALAQQKPLRSTAQRIVVLARQDGSRKATLLVSRWAWVLSALDAATTDTASPYAWKRASAVGHAVIQVLHRCRTFHRPDAATELLDLLLSPVTAATEQSGDTGLQRSVLCELVRLLRAASAIPEVADLLKEVCLWRYDIFSSFAVLADFWTASEPQPSTKVDTNGIASQLVPVVSSVIAQALCLSASSVGRDSLEGVTNISARAALAAHLLRDGCVWGNGAGVLFYTPEILVALGRALRQCGDKPVALETYSGVMRGFIATCSVAFSGPYGGSPKAATAREHCLYTQQLAYPTLANAAPPVWLKAQETLRNRGRGMIASFALHYVLALWSLAHDASADAAVFCERMQPLYRILLVNRPSGAQTKKRDSPSTLCDADSVALLMPAAERDALRTLFALYVMHYHLSSGLTAVDGHRRPDGRSAAQVADATASTLLSRFFQRRGSGGGERHAQLVSRFVDRICCHEAPDFLGVYRSLAHQLSMGLTTPRAALVHGVASQLSPMAIFCTATTVGPKRQQKQSTKDKVHALVDAGDWAAALAAIPTVFTSPLHVVRKSLGACEAAQPHPGVAWQGALAVWRYAKKLQEQQQKRSGAVFRLGLPEVGRIATLLAHGHRWRESVKLFNEELADDQIDGYVFSQVAFALRSNSAGRADDVVDLWARWRCRVGDVVSPTTAMVDALVSAGLVGSQGGAAMAACLLVKEAVTSQSKVGSAAATLPGTERPLRLSAPKTERTVQQLLSERWHESWQSALAVAVASGRPALVSTVAAHSPVKKSIYHASTQAMAEGRAFAELDATQRAALARHVISSRDAFSPSPAEERNGEEGHNRQSLSRRQRAAREIENVERVLQDLLND